MLNVEVYFFFANCASNSIQNINILILLGI